MRRRLAALLLLTMPAAAAATAAPAAAQEPAPGAQPAPPAAPTPGAPPLAPGQIDLEKDTQSAALVDAPAPPAEAPPPPPYKATVVIDTSLGALVFLGKFGKTAPPGPWLHTQVGYELFKWLMVFGEGELAFSDTSGTQDPPKTRSFPIYGFGGGARFTARFTERIGAYLQGDLGAMKADIRKRALEIIGFKDAESLGLYFGGRIGLEWYQLDRHFGLGVTAGMREATGFKRTGGASDTPLALDAGGSLRYAF